MAELFQNITISDADFNQMVQFIQKNYGIDLSKKRQFIISRLSHSLKVQGFHDFSEFLERLMSQKDPADLELVINKLTTNYTYFMREKEHFTFLQTHILPELAQKHQKDKSLAIWSAGCSSG